MAIVIVKVLAGILLVTLLIGIRWLVKNRRQIRRKLLQTGAMPREAARWNVAILIGVVGIALFGFLVKLLID
jgi:hypothetical protein